MKRRQAGNDSHIESKASKHVPGSLKRVLYALKSYQWLIVLSILFSAVTVGLTLYLPILVGRAIDRLVGPGQVDFKAVGKLLFQIACTAALTALVQWLVSVINNRITFGVVWVRWSNSRKYSLFRQSSVFCGTMKALGSRWPR